MALRFLAFFGGKTTSSFICQSVDWECNSIETFTRVFAACCVAPLLQLTTHILLVSICAELCIAVMRKSYLTKIFCSRRTRLVFLHHLQCTTAECSVCVCVWYMMLTGEGNRKGVCWVGLSVKPFVWTTKRNFNNNKNVPTSGATRWADTLQNWTLQNVFQFSSSASSILQFILRCSLFKLYFNVT